MDNGVFIYKNKAMKTFKIMSIIKRNSIQINNSILQNMDNQVIAY